MQVGLIVLAVIIIIPGIYVIATYNTLVSYRNHVKESWADIDTELKRRYDLIPNLVNTVKGYATHEKDLLEELTRLRGVCKGNNGSPARQAGTENELQALLHKVLVRVEAYPDLKANKNFLDLQDELTNTEDRIQAARRFFNGNVRDINNKIQMFPSSIIAGMFSFEESDFFELKDDVARRVPSVSVQN
jgi:LemA protein